MVSFYPGPSEVYSKVPLYLKDAYAQGVMSMNHRSAEFMTISQRCVVLLKEKLKIPEDYHVFFASSATECWEIIAQSLVQKHSVHIFNGAFGKKWFDYTQRIKSDARAIEFDQQEKFDLNMLPRHEADTLCITQNETSNGTQVSNRSLHAIRKAIKGLIAVDATSSLGGVWLDLQLADVWFASVQKCFGLPAGLAVMICSPAALQRAQTIGDHAHYNSLLFMAEMMEHWQTSCTPNVLDIYLLMRVMEDNKPIEKIDTTITTRYHKWEAFFKHPGDRFNLLIKNPAVRSRTVLTVEAAPPHVALIKEKAREAGFILGEGYGELKSTTFRIANFPAIKRTDITQLMEFLHDYR
jgi:phosphoserine aminotransferase